MRLPYQKFIKYLLITRHSDQEIINLLESFGLPKMGNLYLAQLREQDIFQNASPDMQKFLLSKDATLTKLNRADLKDKWVNEFGLLAAHKNEEEYISAYNIFGNRKYRDYVNLYLLCNDIDHDKLCQQYENRFHIKILPQDLKVYKEYFFDVSEMTDRDWQSFLIGLPPKLRLLYECAPNRQSRYIQWKLGDTVDITPTDIATQLNIDFYFLTCESHLERKEGWEEVAPKFANVSLGAGDRAMKSKKSADEDYQRDMIDLLEVQEDFCDFDNLYQDEEDE